MKLNQVYSIAQCITVNKHFSSNVLIGNCTKCSKLTATILSDILGSQRNLTPKMAVNGRSVIFHSRELGKLQGDINTKLSMILVCTKQEIVIQ